jgi:hypothetical protein
MQQLNEKAGAASPGITEEQEAPDFSAQAEPELEVDLLSQELSRPIRAHDDDNITVLRWREPTAGDIERAGNPIKIDFFSTPPQLTFDEKKMSAMISLLAGVPPSSIKMISAADWNSIAWKLVRFFMPAMAR